jgi:predicted DCC family thiol-disulfide oxidoreductase YuxK
MFSKLDQTFFPPAQPTMLWDGDCGFCHYWIIRWWIKTGDKITYKKYQLVGHAYKDISTEDFKSAVRLVMTDGTIYSGPSAAYKAYEIAGKYLFLLKWYENNKLFRYVSDFGYQWVANNRYHLFTWTKRLFGKNPRSPKNHWINYLFALITILFGVVVLVYFFLRN